MTTTAIGNFGANFLTTTIATKEDTPRITETMLIFSHALMIWRISSTNSPEPELLPKIFGICMRMIVTAIPLMKPPMTGVEIKSTIFPAWNK